MITMSNNNNDFSDRVLTWFNQHGRKHLPWQHPVTPYRVWISEVMLQQTQVATVIPYFNRFMVKFPELAYLAKADIDTVLHYWSGLGYYARGRNLHKASQIIMRDHGGELPQSLALLMALPGLGRSTSGAILSIGYNQRAAILDGNVKRVLARYHGVKGSTQESHTIKTLWEHAEQYTPHDHIAEYTQAMMDLGAMICTRSQPACRACPLSNDCYAYQHSCVSEFPHKKQKKLKPTRHITMLICQNYQHQVLLAKRPSEGIWGGLWSFPELPAGQNISQWCAQHAIDTTEFKGLPEFQHTFTHFHLIITPIIVFVEKIAIIPKDMCWYDKNQQLGIAKPVTFLLEELENEYA